MPMGTYINRYIEHNVIFILLRFYRNKYIYTIDVSSGTLYLLPGRRFYDNEKIKVFGRVNSFE